MTEILIIVLCGLLVGMSKTGIQGIGMLVVPLMALQFGAKPSTGLLLPMLCFADLLAVVYYRRSASWKHIARLLPAALAGFAMAIWIDRHVPENEFRLLLGGCLVLTLGIMWWNERGKAPTFNRTENRWFAPLFGLIGGFTTMIGNAAGPVMAIYLLAMRMNKLQFIGTSAWFFLVVNYLKLPLQIFVWDNITWQTLQLNLYAIPTMFLGAWIGVRFVDWLPEEQYRNFVLAITVVSTLLMFL